MRESHHRQTLCGVVNMKQYLHFHWCTMPNTSSTNPTWCILCLVYTAHIHSPLLLHSILMTLYYIYIQPFILKHQVAPLFITAQNHHAHIHTVITMTIILHVQPQPPHIQPPSHTIPSATGAGCVFLSPTSANILLAPKVVINCIAGSTTVQCAL